MCPAQHSARVFLDRDRMDMPLGARDGTDYYPAIFLSDIHLGSKGCQADKLNDFLRRHSCSTLYLVGDIIDGWRMKSSGVYWPENHDQVVRRWREMADAGTKIVYVTGNHDEFMRNHSPARFGNFSVVDEAIHTNPDGARFLVIHGDQFDVVTRYHRWLAWLGDWGYVLLLRINRVYNALRRRFGYGYWSLSAWIKHRVKQAVNFISDYEAAVRRHCERRGLAGVVCGHIHHAEISDSHTTLYVNCGDWVESCTAVVQGRDGQFRIIDWSAAEVVPFKQAVPVREAELDSDPRAA